ncbi:MAG: hypothetical protein WBK51_12940 [Polaromonas sp.]
MINLPTYLALMGGGLTYTVFHSIQLWNSNQLLFWIGMFVAVVNVLNGVVQSLDPTEIHFAWLLFYLVPVGLLLLARFSGHQEFQISTAAQFGMTLPAVLPGKSSDYEQAAWSHYASMAFPMISAGAAKAVEWWRNR